MHLTFCATTLILMQEHARSPSDIIIADIWHLQDWIQSFPSLRINIYLLPMWCIPWIKSYLATWFILGSIILHMKEIIAQQRKLLAKNTEMGYKACPRLREMSVWLRDPPSAKKQSPWPPQHFLAHGSGCCLTKPIHLLAHLCKLLMKSPPTFNNWQISLTQMHFDTT